MYTNIEEDGGRGIAVDITERLASKANPIEVAADYKESIWVQLNISDSTKLSLGCIYRSPSSPMENDIKLHQMLARVNTNRGPSQVIIT